MIKVLIADDHSMIRQGLKAFLSLDEAIEVVGIAVDGYDALEQAPLLQPDVILLDLMMPGMDGLETLGLLRERIPETKILILTSNLETDSIARAVRAGANGYLLKNMEANELCQAIKGVVNGQLLISAQAALLLAGPSQTSTKLVTPLTPTQPFATPINNSPENLTTREKEVIRLIAEGKANKEIARDLGLSEGTVKTHVSIILSKLGLQTRTQAALYAASSGLLNNPN